MVILAGGVLMVLRAQTQESMLKTLAAHSMDHTDLRSAGVPLRDYHQRKGRLALDSTTS